MKNIIRLSKEVKNALNLRKPIVSLESTIISHGLPYPQNLEMAQSVEDILREHKVTPATCAFINGVPHVGLSTSQIHQFAELPRDSITKVSRRDIGYVMANKLNGGTTIASTMILSHLMGIKFFATGGLGGVHRDVPGQFSMDVSADITELGRTPVSVICAGPKSILDIDKTLEFLETQGVFVGTFNEDRKPVSELKIPGFYCRESSVASPFAFGSFGEAAKIVHNQQLMSLQSGNVFCIPPPKETALESQFIDNIIDKANDKARVDGISGKQLTPYLLSEIASATKGKSVDCNISLVKNNARAAAVIANEYYKLEKATEDKNATESIENGGTVARTGEPKPHGAIHADTDPSVNLLVVGSVALDTISTMTTQTKLKDSNIGKITNSIGGVGYNLALASSYISNSTKFISRIGTDFAGDTIAHQIEHQGVINVKLTKGSCNSAQYSCVHDEKGDLIVACADMSIIEDTEFSQQVIEEINQIQPRVVLMDCNLSSKSIGNIIEHFQGRASSPNFIVEPTSYVKAERLGKVKLSTFPHNKIKLVTPTIEELNTMYESMEKHHRFDLDRWFPILDAMNIDASMRDKLNQIDASLYAKGVFQQCFHLLPFFQNVLVKLGDRGAMLASIVVNHKDLKSVPTTSKYKPTATVVNDVSSKLGVVVEYFAAPKQNQDLSIVNVTGAGDTMVGYLAARLASEWDVATATDAGDGRGALGVSWLDCEVKSCEQVWKKWEDIYKAQLASGLTLLSENSVSDKISRL
ncbi:hypothetical protein KGF57_001291 [Candida theae]|uniref:Carbohydrate kinase PfkB domain-containing protein n=1 Tax=Candida theae TaxID=1198502 RepID=A0AAD5BHD8_9ASCO|nr:uncharacterized protein KGF57_001291 [Candida theae]KAI5963413.1 hypothetical protein KGF57_001291 [Candida theae]